MIKSSTLHRTQTGCSSQTMEPWFGFPNVEWMTFSFFSPPRHTYYTYVAVGRWLTINCEVHPAAIVEGFVLFLQHQHPALIPALVLGAHWINLEGGLPMQRGSTWRQRGTKEHLYQHLLYFFFFVSSFIHSVLNNTTALLIITNIHHSRRLSASLQPFLLAAWIMHQI